MQDKLIISEYKIAHTNDIASYIDKGFQPYGSPLGNRTTDDAWQAMVKYKNVRYISPAKLEELEHRDDFLTELENAGVDNWNGYEIAQEEMSKWSDEQPQSGGLLF